MTDTTTPKVRLRFLGSFRLTGLDGREAVVRSKKNRALLAVLALSPGGIASRERIGSLLWGSHGEEQARASLRQSLAILRKDVGALWDAMCLDRGDNLVLQLATVETDVLDLLGQEKETDLERLRQAAAHLQGEFLGGVSLNEEGFEDWLRAERARLTAAAIGLLGRLAELESGARRVAAASELVRLDPLRESSHRALMRAYVAQGDASLALKQFEECRSLLKRELRVEPSPETLALRDEIMRGAREPVRVVEAPRVAAPEPRPVQSERLSIAVLPFADSQSDPDQGFFADGVSEELITNLSRFRHLFVIARSSSFSFRGAELPPSEIGKKLGVKFLLFGTVKRFGAQLRVTAELVEAETGAAVWRERFDRPAADVLDVIDELSGIIVAGTVGHIDSSMLRGTRRKQTDALAAYELFLQGRTLMHSIRREDKLLARGLFEQAIAIDGQFAQAWAQLANTYLYELYSNDGGQALDKAAELAARAVAIDEEEPWCHMVLGLTHLHRRRYELALKHTERSVQLNPNDPGLLAKLGLVMTDMGDGKRAIPLIRKAMQLNPVNADSYSDYLALALMGAREFAQALEVLKAAPQDAFFYHAWLAICYAQTGDMEMARRHGARTLEMDPDFSLSRVAEREPLRDPAELELWINSLREAGIGE